MDARVRGVYATALTKLLMEHGFRIVQPSDTIMKRLGLEYILETPDLDVDDRLDRQGVWAAGGADAVNAFRKVLRENLDDAILRRSKLTLHGVYKGVVVDAAESLVDIGCAIGVLDRSNPCGTLSDGVELVVQVKKAPPAVKKPLLSTEISLPTKYVVLVEKPGVWVSKKVTDPDARSRLLNLGAKFSQLGLGVIWRPSAVGQPDEVLEAEVGRVAEEWRKIMDEAVRVDAPTTLREGNRILDAEFPALSKEKLDEVRGQVAPTLPRHHYYRACGGAISSSLTLAEKLLEQGHPMESVERLFREAINQEYPLPGSKLRIIHVKLGGEVLSLGEARLESLNPESGALRLARVIRGRGVYDGLGVPREPGDVAVTETRVGSWLLKTTYLTSRGEWKGTYVNINTPVELYPRKIRYVDLEVDVCIWPNGRVRVLDMDGFRGAVEEGVVGERLAKKVESLVDEVVEEAESGCLRPAKYI